MGPLRIDYVVADVPPNPSFAWHKTGIPPLNISLLRAMTPPSLDGRDIIARCHHERTMGRYDVCAERPDILALSVYTPGARRAYELAAESRSATSQHGEHIRLLAGGHHATALPLEAIAHVDALVRGETTSELLTAVLRWLVQQIEKGSDEKRIFELSPAVSTAAIPPRPIPNRTWYNPFRYYMSNGLQTSLGCPFACHFCATTFAEGALFRPVDYAALDAEAATLRRGGITALIDDNFLPTSEGDHARRVCDILRKHHVHWQAELTALTLHRNMRELVPVFARSGCEVLFFGFETIRGGMAKSADLDRYAELIRCCHDHGIAVIGAFVFGVDDDEDASIFEQTVEWATAVQCDYGYFAINTPYPGAADFEEAVRNDLIIDWDWEHYDTWYPVRRFAKISPQAMYEGTRQAFRWFYGNSSVRRRTLGQFPQLLRSGARWTFVPKRIRNMLLGAVVGHAIGTADVMRWRLDMPYEEYQETAIRTPNPHVLAQFAVGKPVGQFDPHCRMQELRGDTPSRTADLVGSIPVTHIAHGMEVVCPSL